MRYRLLAAAVLSYLAMAHGAEIDSVSGRSSTLDESLPRLDAMVDAWLRHGVEQANAREGCDAARLYREVRGAIALPFVGQLIAERLNEDAALDRRRVELSESVYRDLGVLTAVSLHLRGLGAVIRLNGNVVGVDKIGHFFVQGWEYFDVSELEGEGIEAALDWGEHTERTYFGLMATGIYSHADLVANFEGMRFWSRLVGRRDDPLERGRLYNRPYVACEKRFLFFGERRWVVKRNFHFWHYVTGAWDEGVNCNAYRNAEISRRVARRIQEQGERHGTDLSCPVDTGACVRARKRYDAFAAGLLHPACFSAADNRGRWQRAWEKLVSW